MASLVFWLRCATVVKHRAAKNGRRGETPAVLDMSYLQNGQCFANVAAAKADFLSRIDGIEQRQAAMTQLEAMSGAEIQAMFPQCVHPSVWFSAYLAALFGVVVLLLCLRSGKAAAEI